MKKFRLISNLIIACSWAALSTLAHASELLTVRFLNMQGETSSGQVAVTSVSRDAVQGVFNDLFIAGFRFENVAPMGIDTGAFEAALQAHQSFSLTTADTKGLYALLINPRANPVLRRKATAKTSVSVRNTAPEVLPFDAVFAVNNLRSPLLGRITPEVEAVFAKHGFVRYTGQVDQAYMGMFVLPNANSPKTTNVVQRPMKDAPPPAPVVRPLSQAMKDALIKSGTWKTGCPVPLERLNVVEFSYRNMAGNTFRGSLIVANILGPSLAKIMQSMYELGFPLEHPRSAGGPKDPLSFGGTDAFNCRPITGGGGYSLHSYGTAIDINFGINPYIGGYSVDAAKHLSYATDIVPSNADLRLFVRTEQPQVTSGYSEAIQDLMRQNGYIVWGGNWTNRTDYMHFQTTAFLSFLFPHLDKATGIGLLNLSVKYPAEFHRLDPDIYISDLKKWVLLQQLYPTRFLNAFEKNLPRFTPTMSPDDFLLLIDQDLSATVQR